MPFPLKLSVSNDDLEEPNLKSCESLYLVKEGDRCMKMEIQMRVYGRECARSINFDDTSAGITVGLIDDIPTCEDLVAKIVGDAEKEIRRVGSMVVPAATTRESKL